jgi:hypothetical protein
VTLDAASGNAAITVESGTHVINATLVLARNTSIAVTPPDSTLTLAALASSPVAVTKDGAGTLVVNSVRASSLAINDGAVIVLPNSLASGTSKVGSLSIAADAKLDLKDNKLITNTLAGGASGGVYSGVQGEVQRASDFGAWDMPGLTTSMPDAAAGLTTIGVSTGAAMRGLGPSDTDTFAGQTITGASTVAMYTYAGDANLDGVIDGGDYGIIDNFAQIPGADSYFNGDFNYDGVIDGGDYGIIDNNIQAQGAPFPTGGSVGLSGVTAIPEPSACGFAIFTAAAALARRRRRSMQCSWACRIIKD